MSFRIVSRVTKKLCERICVVYKSWLCFVIVNQLHHSVFAVNIKEYHWLVHQPITPLPDTIQTVPLSCFGERQVARLWEAVERIFINGARRCASREHFMNETGGNDVESRNATAIVYTLNHSRSAPSRITDKFVTDYIHSTAHQTTSPSSSL